MLKSNFLKEKLIALAVLTASLATASFAQATNFQRADAQLLAKQWAEYEADRRKSIVEIQPFRRTARAEAADGTRITLTSLNPDINSWFLLEVLSAQGYGRPLLYHLELANPQDVRLSLSDGDTPALIFERNGLAEACTPWQGRRSALVEAKASRLPYAPICNGRAFVRNKVHGSATSREVVAQFLRDNVPLGDSLVNMIKGSLYEDAYMKSGEVVAGGDAGQVAASLGQAKLAQAPVMRTYFGFSLAGAEGGAQAGSWYAVKDAPGIYASAMKPGMIAPEVLNGPGRTNRLDSVERQADVYLVAFDLTQFDLGYEVGTDHPRLGWSPRPPASVRKAGLPGPDGFDTAAPLARTGMLNPALTERVAATFAGGYKRSHAAWRAGPMATTNKGNHYGFLSHGVIFSKLYPGLSTLFVLDDGSIHMRVWRAEDRALLPRLRFARQNGVPLINDGVPGKLVTSWLGGNWSGSAEADLRTLRGGACMKRANGRKFLIYAYFSTATPSAMARTFQAYGCDHAMLLDMNAQEHTYMALYTRKDGRLIPNHLVTGMAAIDARGHDGAPLPRFVAYPDNRDFFYLLRK